MPAENMEKPEMDSLVTALEEAVYKGNIGQAKEMAEGLAKCRAKLSIKLIAVGPPADAAAFRLDVVIESSTAEKMIAPIGLQVSSVITVYGLKVKMALLYGIPMRCQRWIVGKKIPKDTESLRKLGITMPTKVFLYVMEAKALKLDRGQVSEEEENLKRFHDNLIRKGGNPDLALTPTEYSRYLESRRENQRQRPRQFDGRGSGGTLGPRGGSRGQPIEAWGGRFTETDGPYNDEGRLPSPGRHPNGEYEDTYYEGDYPDRQYYDETDGQQYQTLPAERGARHIDRGRPSSGERSPQAAARQQPRQPPVKPKPLIQPPKPAKLTAKDVGWSCGSCTFVNPPRIPACRSCLGARPDGYQIPEPGTYVMDEGEERGFLEEQQNELLLKEWEQQEKTEQAQQAQVNLAAILQTAEQDIVTNTEPFDCPVCFTELEPGQGVKLRECLHDICRECLENHINLSNEPEVKCPYTDGEHDCEQVIPDREIKKIISKEDYERYLHRGLNRAEAAAADAFHCKSPDCVGLCFYDDEVNFFDCEVCQKQNCLTCKAIHEGQNCKQYQEELKIKAGNDEAAKKTHEALQQMLKDGSAMNCPKCKIIIQKKSGCDWMMCSVCKVEICWVTKGPRWGPKGRGDTSAGCKCRFAATGGVAGKCHPNCGNCH